FSCILTATSPIPLYLHSFPTRRSSDLGQETHVAERAGINDRLEIFRGNRIQLFGFGGVDQVKQPRERIAQIEAAATAVADVEHTAQLVVQFLLVVEIRIIPVDNVPGWRIQAAFTHNIPLNINDP